MQRFQINKLFLFEIRQKCINSECSQSLYLFTKRSEKQTAVITDACHCYQLHTEYHVTFLCQYSLHTQKNYWDRHYGFKRDR